MSLASDPTTESGQVAVTNPVSAPSKAAVSGTVSNSAEMDADVGNVMEAQEAKRALARLDYPEATQRSAFCGATCL